MSNILLERWSKLAGITTGSYVNSLLVESGGSTTYPKAAETLALLGILSKYKDKVHPVISTYYQKLESAAVAVYEEDIAEIHKNTNEFNVVSSVDGVNDGAMPKLPDAPMVVDKGRFTSAEDFRDKDGLGPGNRGFKVDLNPFQSKTVARREAAADSPTNPDGTAKNAAQLAADEAMPRYKDSGGDDGFGPSKSADAKRKGDNADLQNAKWGDVMKTAVIDAVKTAAPDAPAGYQLVNILQHQHGQGHPDIVMIWQKEASASPERLMSFSSKRDEFFPDENGNLSDADIAKLKEEIQENITGVILWPIHVKTGTGANRFSAIRGFNEFTGDAAAAILGSTMAIDSLDSFLRTNVAALETAMRNTSGTDTVRKNRVTSAATNALLTEVQEFIEEKFKYNQYKLFIDGVGPFKAGDTESSRKNQVTAEFESFDADTLIHGVSSRKSSGTSSVRIEMVLNGAKSEVKLQKRSGSGVDLEYVPTMAWENPQALAYNISKHFGTAINVEDFIKDDGQPDWAAAEALFGTPFDRITDESGKLVALAARKPMQNHQWFGPAVNHESIKDAEMSLNDLLASKKITKGWLKDLGLMESLSKYSLGHLLSETASNPFGHSEMDRTARKARKKDLTKKRYSKLKNNKAAAYMIDNPSTAAQFEDEADKNNDGIVTNSEFADWETAQSRKGDKRFNPSEAELAAVTNDVREFEGNFINLPTGVTADTKMSIIDMWDNVLKPAMDKMSISPDGKRQGAAFDKLDKDITDRFASGVSSTLSSSDGFKIEDNYKRKYSLSAKLLK